MFDPFKLALAEKSSFRLVDLELLQFSVVLWAD